MSKQEKDVKQARAARNSRKAENLQPWRFQPGVSGNPKGRPKGSLNRATLLSRAYMNQLEQDYQAGKVTFAEAIAAKQIHSALHAKPGTAVLAAKEIADRTEGKPAQAITVQQAPMDEATMKRIANIAERLLPKREPLTLDGAPHSFSPDCECPSCKGYTARREEDRKQKLPSEVTLLKSSE